MAERREVTRDEFLAVRPARKHDEELHGASSAVCIWREGGAEYEEHQPDMGRCRWFVTE